MGVCCLSVDTTSCSNVVSYREDDLVQSDGGRDLAVNITVVESSRWCLWIRSRAVRCQDLAMKTASCFNWFLLSGHDEDHDSDVSDVCELDVMTTSFIFWPRRRPRQCHHMMSVIWTRRRPLSAFDHEDDLDSAITWCLWSKREDDLVQFLTMKKTSTMPSCQWFDVMMMMSVLWLAAKTTWIATIEILCVILSWRQHRVVSLFLLSPHVARPAPLNLLQAPDSVFSSAPGSRNRVQPHTPAHKAAHTNWRRPPFDWNAAAEQEVDVCQTWFSLWFLVLQMRTAKAWKPLLPLRHS